MKKYVLSMALAALLAACNVTVVPPGPTPGTPVTVDDPDGAQATLAPNQTHRFELTVGADPVRVDVKHQEATADGELYVRVFDREDTAYAHTDRRDLFARTDAALTSLGVSAQDINVSFPYSVNLPKNMGKVYVEVTNKTGTNAGVTVTAVTRNEVVRDQESLAGPPASGPETSKTYGGALLFLGQEDTYVYDGPDNYLLSFDVPAGDVVKARLILNGNTASPVVPGTSNITLFHGDTLKVASEGLERAGFCTSTVDAACADGIDSGEYSITITRN
ncbi:MAG TPA: hypothetical protein ENK37_04270 [Oceanithermus profundus]|uniref:DUF4382 domain-containing protein n=1 Tax=Oceanithermus profundus TaxID=187137 RepID=A0A7C4Z8J1_9DEIN|nr:hypothetical protein [Oceanithermus profundus]